MSKRQEREKIVAKKRAKGKLRKHKTFIDFVTEAKESKISDAFMTGESSSSSSSPIPIFQNLHHTHNTKERYHV